MDTTENNIQPPPLPLPEPGLLLTIEAQTYLREAGRWAQFLSIIGFIYCGLILVLALFVGSIFTIMSHVAPGYERAPIGAAGGMVSFIYIMIDVLYFFFPYYLYRFSDRVKKGIVFQDPGYMTRAAESLKSFLKLWGIVTIVVICLCIIVFLIAIAIGVGSQMMNR